MKKKHDALQSSREKENIFLSILFALISYLAVATLGVFVKLLPSDVNLGISLFAQYFVAFALTAVLVLPNGTDYLKTTKPFLHILRVIAGVVTFGLFFLSLNYISLVNSIVLRSTTPFFIPIILYFWKRQKISMPVLSAIVIGFVGIFLIIKPSFQHINIGMLIALGSGLAMAVAALVIRRLNRTEKKFQALFFYFFGATLLLLPFFLVDFHKFYSIINEQIIILLCLIGITMFILQYTLIKAFSYGKPSMLGPISYTAILFSGLYDWFIWHNIPDYWSVIGIILIILTTLIILFTGLSHSEE